MIPNKLINYFKTNLNYLKSYSMSFIVIIILIIKYLDPLTEKKTPKYNFKFEICHLQLYLTQLYYYPLSLSYFLVDKYAPLYIHSRGGDQYTRMTHKYKSRHTVYHDYIFHLYVNMIYELVIEDDWQLPILIILIFEYYL